MIRIGLVGENPSDTGAIRALLRKAIADQVDFVDLIRDVNGSNLENNFHKNRFRREYELLKREGGGVDLVVFIRDLDDLETNRERVLQRKSYFNEWNKTVDEKGIFLLNIFELEALIWADIEGYNLKYGTSIPPLPDPMLIWEPKEELKKHIRYSEGDSPKIFEEALRVDEVEKNCRYFAAFLSEFKQHIP